MVKLNAFLAVGLMALISCQQQTASTLPAVTFDSPQVLAPTTAPSAGAVAAVIKPAPIPPATTRPVLAVADVIPTGWIPSVDARPWRWIVIHHSATNFGDAKIIDGWHRARGFDELGYHFVIGNGSNSGDGQIEIGPRWVKQKWGAHTKTADNRFNDFGIGICLVGNFDIDHPTDAQMKSVARLVAFLMKRYHIPADRVIGHREAKPTDCPGRNMSVAKVREMAEDILAKSGDSPTPKLAVNNELLHEVDQK